MRKHFQMWKSRSHHKTWQSSRLLFQALRPSAQAKGIPSWSRCLRTIGAKSQAFIHPSCVFWALPIKTQGCQLPVLPSCCSLGVACLSRACASGQMLHEPGSLGPRGEPWPFLAEHTAFLTRLWVNGTPRSHLLPEFQLLLCEKLFCHVTAGFASGSQGALESQGHFLGRWDPFRWDGAHVSGLWCWLSLPAWPWVPMSHWENHSYHVKYLIV